MREVACVFFKEICNQEPQVVELIGHFPEDGPTKYIVYQMTIHGDEDADIPDIVKYVVSEFCDGGTRGMLVRFADEEEVLHIRSLTAESSEAAETETL